MIWNSPLASSGWPVPSHVTPNLLTTHCGVEQEKQRLDPGRVVQQQPKQQHVINMGLDFNVTHSPIGDAIKKVPDPL